MHFAHGHFFLLENKIDNKEAHFRIKCTILQTTNAILTIKRIEAVAIRRVLMVSARCVIVAFSRSLFPRSYIYSEFELATAQLVKMRPEFEVAPKNSIPNFQHESFGYA